MNGTALKDIISKYDTSLPGTRKMMGEFVPALEQERARRKAERRRELYPYLYAPQLYSAQQVKEEFDYDLEEGWSLKLFPDTTNAEGYGISYLSPQGWQFFEDESAISPEGKHYTGEELALEQEEQIERQTAAQEREAAGGTEAQMQWRMEKEEENTALRILEPYQIGKKYDVREPIRRGVSKDIIDYLFGEGTYTSIHREDTGRILSEEYTHLGEQGIPMLEGEPLGSQGLKALDQQRRETLGEISAGDYQWLGAKNIADIIERLYHFDVQQLAAWAEGNPEDFLDDIVSKGRTPDTEQLLKMFDLTEDEINEVFAPQTYKPEIKKLFSDVFGRTYTDKDMSNMLHIMEDDPQLFWGSLRLQGRTPEVEKLMLELGVEQAQIDSFFPEAPKQQVPIWQSIKTGETITQAEREKRYPKGYESGLDEWVLTGEAAHQYGAVFKVFGQGLTKLPRAMGAAILQATQGQGGASVVDKDWADRFIEDANTDLEKFATETTEKYKDTLLAEGAGFPITLTDIAQLPQNLAFSLTSMGAGLAVGAPTAMVPLPGARVAAYAAGTAASGAVAYRMTTYQIMQQYLEFKNDEKIAETGKGLTAEEEKVLKGEFESAAHRYGLWEAIPEAISNLAFFTILTAPLSKVAGKYIAGKILTKIVAMYGQELLTETITQKGQAAIEAEVGLRNRTVTWAEAFKEVAPQTFLLTTVMAGAGQVVISSRQAINKSKASLKKEVSVSSPLHKGLEKHIEETKGAPIVEGKIKEGVPLVEKPKVAEVTKPEIKKVEAPEIKKGVPLAEKVEAVPKVAKEEVYPTLVNQVREEHREIQVDVTALRSALKGKGDIGSRLTNLLLKGTERELRNAEALLRKIETGERTTERELTEAREALTGVRKAQQAKLETMQAQKQALVDFLNTLPLAVRGKLIASVKNVKTELGLRRAISRAERLAEQHSQRVLRTEIHKEIKRTQAKVKDHILKGKFTPETQRYLDVLNHNLGMDRDTAREKIAENIQKYDRGELNYEDMLRANEALNFAGIKGMSSAELANTLDYIKALRDIGRSERQAKRDVENERIGAIRTDIGNVLTGEKGLKTGIGAVSRKQLATKQRWLDTFVNWQYSLDNLADKLSKFDKTSKPYQSVINKFTSQMHRATARQAIGVKEAYNDVKNVVKEVYGVKSNHDINQALNGLREEVNLGTFKLTEEYIKRHPGATTVDIRMTRDEMIAKYMQMQDPTLDNTFTTGMGWSQEVRDAVDAQLTEQEKKLADSIFQFYENYYETLNPIYQELYGIDMPHNAVYSPRFRDFEGTIAEEILTFQDAQRYAGVTAQSIKARQQNIRPLKFNGATQLLSNHIDQMEHFKAFALPIRNMRRVFSSTEIRQAIEQYHGRGILQLIDRFTNQMARDGVETAATNRTADMLRRNFTKSILAVKPVIGLKQLPSLFGYISEMKTGEFFGGIADYWKSPITNFKFLYNNSETYRARISQGFERDIRATLAKEGLGKISGKTNITDWFLAQIRMMDTVAVTQGMWAKYKAGLGEGLSQADAISGAEDTTGRTQPSFGIDTLSALQNSGSWFKLMTMFQNQPNKYFRIEADNLRNFKYGRGSRVKAVSTILLVHVVLPCMFRFIADAFQWKPERQKRAMIFGPINFILIGGQAFQSVWGWLTDQPFDYQISPVLQTTRDIQNAFLKARKMLATGKDPYKDITSDDVAALIEYLAKAVGQVTGLPTPYFVQVEKQIRHLKEEGKDVELKHFLFSEWSLEPPAKNAEEKVSDLNLKLGEPKEGQEEKPLTEKELQIYDTTDWFRGIGNVYAKTLPQDIIDDPKASKESKAWAEYEIARSQADILPNVSLHKINTEDSEDTIINYYQQWKAREKITSLAKLEEFDKLYPKAYLGNVTRQQYSLLVKYLESEDKDAFLEKHPELEVTPRSEWLKANPRENALMALAGQAKILTLEAYNEFKKLLKELDIPNDAIPELTLPPEGSVENYFKYNELGEEFGYNSAEVRLIVASDGALREWLGREPIDTPIKSLELTIKHRDLFERYDAYGDRESPEYVENDDKRQEARDKLKADNPEWVDDMRRIEAIEHDAPDEITKGWVDRGHIVDEFGGSSSEAKVWFVNNMDTYRWALDNGLTKDDGGLPDNDPRVQDGRRSKKWNEKVLRLNVEMAGLDETSEEYLTLKRKKAAYKKLVPEEYTDNYLEYSSMEKPEGQDLWYEDDWYLEKHADFYRAMVKAGIWKEKDFSKVPTKKVFQLYKMWKDIPLGQERRDFEARHSDLDQWLHIKFGTKLESQR